MTLEGAEYLGVVGAVVFEPRGGPRAYLYATHVFDSARQEWVCLSNPAEEFPTRGQVIWLGAFEEVKERTLWRFMTEPNPRSDASDRSKIVPTTAQPVVELLDLRGRGDLDDLRRVMTSSGMSWPAPVAGKVLMWLMRDTIVGPVPIVVGKAQGTIRLEDETCQNPLRRVRLAQDGSSVRPQGIVDTKGRTRWIVPARAHVENVGWLDWAPDGVIVGRALRRVREIDSEYAETLGLTAATVERMVEKLNLDGTDGDGDLDRQRFERAARILQQRKQSPQFARELTDVVRSLPGVREDLERHSREVRAAAKAKADEEAKAIMEEALRLHDEARTEAERVRRESREALDRDLSEKRSELERLSRDVEEQRATIQVLRHEEETQRAALDAQVGSLGSELEARLSALLEKPEHALAEVALIRAASRLFGVVAPGALPTNARGTHRETPRAASSSPSHVLAAFMNAAPGAERIAAAAEVRKPLRDLLRAVGVSTSVAWPLHASLLGGLVPLVTGEEGFAALTAYAAGVAGGRLLWVPTSPALLEPRDLLGRVDPATRSVVPEPNGLLDLLMTAAATEDLYLVVLDGINRAPIEAFLLPLLACYRDAWRLGPGVARSLSIAHPNAVDEADPYRQAVGLRWPPNVLLAGTLVGGIATLPLPPDLWSFATFVPTAAAERTGAVEAGSEPSARSSVELVAWKRWREEARRVTTDAWDGVVERLGDEGVRIPVGVARACREFVRALGTWNDGNEAIAQVVLCSLVPRAVAVGTGDPLRKAVDKLKLLDYQIAEALDDPSTVLARR
jgi:hypothetical protein